MIPASNGFPDLLAQLLSQLGPGRGIGHVPRDGRMPPTRAPNPFQPDILRGQQANDFLSPSSGAPQGDIPHNLPPPGFFPFPSFGFHRSDQPLGDIAGPPNNNGFAHRFENFMPPQEPDAKMAALMRLFGEFGRFA